MRCGGVEKVETPKKMNVELLLHVHAKFQPPISIQRGDMHEINPPKKELVEKPIFKAERGSNEDEKLKPTKGTSKTPTKCTCEISNPWLNLEKRYAWNTFFRVKKEQTSLSLPSDLG